MFQLGQASPMHRRRCSTDLHAAAPGPQQAGEEPAVLQQRRPAVADLARRRRPRRQGRARQRERRDRGARPVEHQGLPRRRPDREVPARASTTRSNAVEEDSCARCDLRQQPGEADRRVQALDQKMGTTLHGDQTVPCKWANGPRPGTNPNGGNPGYTGMEGLLNYAYVQTNSLNLFDELGHALGITLVSAPGATSRVRLPDRPGAVLRRSGGNSNPPDPKNFAECAGILGDRQPGINYGTNPSGLFGNLRRYDPRVCPRRARTRPADLRPDDAPHAAPPCRRTTAPPRSPQQPSRPSRRRRSSKSSRRTSTRSSTPASQPEQAPRHGQEQLQDLLPPAAAAAAAAAPAAELRPDPAAAPTDNLLNFLLGQ